MYYVSLEKIHGLNEFFSLFLIPTEYSMGKKKTSFHLTCQRRSANFVTAGLRFVL